MTTMTSREFNQDTGRAKREAEKMPVIITDRGQPSHVLMSYDDFVRLSGKGQSIWDALKCDIPGIEDIELDIPPRQIWPERDLNLED
ncbi:MAG: type II toxin-antitoxin system Phd/YefM family antitoxin [Gemmobacter sp.]